MQQLCHTRDVRKDWSLSRNYLNRFINYQQKKLKKIIIAAEDENLNKLEKRNLYLIKFDWQRRELASKKLISKKTKCSNEMRIRMEKTKKRNN